MAAPNRYPPAVWLGNGLSAGSYTSGPYKVVLHTTETRTIPGYAAGKSAPHLTYYAVQNRWVQHTDLTVSARSLRNAAGGPQTNRDSALQVEIVCYSAKSIGDSVGGLWVADLTERNLADIRDFLVWASAEFDIPLIWPEKQAFSYAEANAPGFRLTSQEWDNYSGVLGHQHVPEGNTHWDPGALAWDQLLTEAEMVLRKGAQGAAVKRFQEALLADDPGCLPRFGADSDFGNETVEAVEAFQFSQGLPSTGQIDGITAALLGSFVRGPQGPKGSPGDTGPVGPRGLSGPRGPEGEVIVTVNGDRVV